MQSEFGAGIAVTLVCGVSFQIVGLLFLKFPDPDIRRYAEGMLRDTVSSFIATVVFGVYDASIETVLIACSASAKVQVGTSAIGLLFWLYVLQGKCGSIGKADPLASKIAGLAAIKLWCGLQSWGTFATSSLNSLLVLPVAFVMHAVLSLVSDNFRASWMNRELADDLEEAWDEKVEEGENDCVGIALAYMVSQSSRYSVCGSLPTELGVLAECNGNEASMLLRVALASAGFAVLAQMVLLSRFDWSVRMVRVAHTTSSICCAWCITFAATALASNRLQTGDTMVVSAVSTPLVSCASLMAIMIADRLADRMTAICDAARLTDRMTAICDAALMVLIQISGNCSGVAWLQSFRMAIADVLSMSSWWVSLALLLFTVLLAVPSWRKYIIDPESGTGKHRGMSEVLLQDGTIE